MITHHNFGHSIPVFNPDCIKSVILVGMNHHGDLQYISFIYFWMVRLAGFILSFICSMRICCIL